MEPRQPHRAAGGAGAFHRPLPGARRADAERGRTTPDGYSFEKGVSKTDGRAGFADVWKRGCFGWEYKKDRANLDLAYQQLQLYSVALENPPLLVVSDTKRFRIYTNWTNTVQEKHDSRWKTSRIPARANC